MAIFTDYKLDESYTPTKISIRVGNTFSDVREVRLVGGWQLGGWHWEVGRQAEGREWHERCMVQAEHRQQQLLGACLQQDAARPGAACVLQVRSIELSEPQGWVVVSLPPDDEPE